MTERKKINKFLADYFGIKPKEEFIDSDGSTVTIWDQFPPDFFTPDGFFKLIELVKGNGKWETFYLWSISKYHSNGTLSEIYKWITQLFNKDTFAPAVAEFLGYKEGE